MGGCFLLEGQLQEVYSATGPATSDGLLLEGLLRVMVSY